MAPTCIVGAFFFTVDILNEIVVTALYAFNLLAPSKRGNRRRYLLHEKNYKYYSHVLHAG